GVPDPAAIIGRRQIVSRELPRLDCGRAALDLQIRRHVLAGAPVDVLLVQRQSRPGRHPGQGNEHAGDSATKRIVATSVRSAGAHLATCSSWLWRIVAITYDRGPRGKLRGHVAPRVPCSELAHGTRL